MVTRTEADENGTPLRVFHRAGKLEHQTDGKYVWTHPFDERATCVACQRGVIPPEVRRTA